MKTFTKALQALIAPDALTGNNQYLCEVCGEKTDADRMFCIRSLPPCLRINLQRFVFDWQSLQKQKVRSEITPPSPVASVN
jgi:ubiquitin C-terminal hydrolase